MNVLWEKYTPVSFLGVGTCPRCCFLGGMGMGQGPPNIYLIIKEISLIILKVKKNF
jgi:hypothetical protein